ncbi:processed acidic surface protein [Bacillus atrophaeus]|uniref:processed acidic surface protein n=1 Tax=Bacillus atrophaeus TaxID=1452 RepID=UPI002281BF34|nr:processed acidic surface protein [Bacillus atrophaeus]MCY8485882.1 processed acidic surface protein [Bacillus atrophaeus]MCY8921901.1 processed acidic surface protein [Bacillus atrophaeus]MCY9160968.1 processed acidic surface protein [Bacillus atrophaeus]MED4811829.1 processed acidic surface protein [Bacillus atrophaeus]MED4857876.1 processed acidic surface protein [Bacillus atrophaeus]
MTKKLMCVIICLLIIAPAMQVSAAPKQEELQSYLKEIGMTKTELQTYLKENYDEDLNDFTSAAELREYLGERLTDKALTAYLKEYGMSKKEAEHQLFVFGFLQKSQAIQDVYVFADDFVSALDYITSYTPLTDKNFAALLKKYGLTKSEYAKMFPGDEDIRLFTDSIEDAEEYLSAALEEKQAEEQFMKLFSQIGIDQNELENLYQHMSALEKKDPQFSDKLLALSDRLLDLPSFTSISELSAGEIAELLDVMNDFQDTLQVKTKFYLINGNSKKELTARSLLSVNPAQGSKLLVELYDLNGKFLLDAIFTADMVDSETAHQTGSDIRKAEQIVKESKTSTKPKKTSAAQVEKTVKGAKLPKTAGHYAEWSMFGLLLLAGGLLMIRKLRKTASLK